MTRLRGVLMFLPVPLVLWLFVQQPLGVRVSVGLGIVLMVSHRFYARPFVARHAAHRCLWCGGDAATPVPLPVTDPFGALPLVACGPDHASRARRVLAWASRYRVFLQAGILGALVLFLLVSLGWPGYARTAADAFRLSVAVTVLTLATLGPRSADPGDGPLASPFPIHIQALIGTSAVLWLFRIVGVAWLVLAARSLSGH